MSKLINEIKQDLYGVSAKRNKKTTLMEMVFNDQMGRNPQEIDNPGYDDSVAEYEPDSYDDMQPMQGQTPSEQQTTVDPEIQQMLADIRLAVIKALSKLANKPETCEYDLMKKILQLIDKPIESQNKAQNK